MRTPSPSVACLFAVPLLSLAAAAQDAAARPAPVATGFSERTLTLDGSEHRYVVFVPRDYTAAAQWPVCVFLNGAGECGTDGWLQVSVGLGPAIMTHIERWPFVVVFPQKPNRASAWEDHDAMVMAMLAATEREFSIDPNRRFLTGLSQGGHGTWVLGARHKELWNAIAPVCGYADGDAIAGDLAAMPIWCFHGEDDKAVSVQQSKDITAAIAAAGGDPRLSLYPGVGHDSWVRAYRDEPLAAWLLTVRREPLLARYLAEPDAITSMHIEVFTPLADGGGASLALEGDAATWSFHPPHPFESSLRPQEPTQGELRTGTGRQFLAAQLAYLAVRGGFDAERTGARLPDVADEHERWSIAVALDGHHGAWSYRCLLPKPPGDDAARRVFTAIAALAR